jgi:hypothetical protein
MDALALLRRAVEAGLRVEPAGDKLMVRGPKNAAPMVKLLAEHKAEILAALANTANGAELPATTPWFERAILRIDGEPGLELPCAARRGRLQELDGAVVLHFCAECGAWATYGYDVNLRAGRLGSWYCPAHRSRGGMP